MGAVEPFWPDNLEKQWGSVKPCRGSSSLFVVKLGKKREDGQWESPPNSHQVANFVFLAFFLFILLMALKNTLQCMLGKEPTRLGAWGRGGVVRS